MALPRRGPLNGAVWRVAAFSMLVACSSGSLVLGRIDDGGSSVGDGGASGDAQAMCDPPPPTRHYPFDGSGTEVLDVQGGASARIFGGASLDGTGLLHLDGVDDYVDLPNGVLANLTEASVALWVRRLGHPGYTRLFDFGVGSLGEDPPAENASVGRSHFAATPSTGHTPSGLAALLSDDGPGGEAIAASDVTFDTEWHLVVVTVSPEALSLYYDDARVAQTAGPPALSSIDDRNVWLGRSQYAADPFLAGDYADVRIFGSALTDCAVRSLYAQGPGAP
jgi:hypothetical protein